MLYSELRLTGTELAAVASVKECGPTIVSLTVDSRVSTWFEPLHWFFLGKCNRLNRKTRLGQCRNYGNSSGFNMM